MMLVSGIAAGLLAAVLLAPPASAQSPLAPCGTPCYRALVEYAHIGSSHYFITSSKDDVDALDSGSTSGWVRTGEPSNAGAWMSGTDYYWGYSQAGLPLPVCRYFIPPDSHFLSASAQECDDVAAKHPEFVLETRAAFYAWLPSAEGVCPVDTLNLPLDNYDLIPMCTGCGTAAPTRITAM
ncbi:MAG TPA: hypothetical protein VMN56_08385 [Casimicrobiaceae bacterium]|nr:hypothetical protein [Casimicrobiaceae bacterium]